MISMVNGLLKLCGLGMLALVLALPLHAQNTKGDKPAASREARFQKNTKAKKAGRPSRKRLRPKRTASSLRKYKPAKAKRGGEQAGQPLAPLFLTRPSNQPRNVFPSSRRYVHKPSKNPKRVAGRSMASAPRNAGPRTSRSRNVYPQSGPFVNHSSLSRRKLPRSRRVVPRSASRRFIAKRSINAWADYPRSPKKSVAYRGDITGRKVRRRNFETPRPDVIEERGAGRQLSSTPALRRNNLYPQTGPVSRRRRADRNPVVSNRATLDELERMQSRPPIDPRKKRRIRPRSASRPYLAKRSINAWARFPRPQRKRERAVNRDLAGQPLRKRNFETPRPDIIEERRTGKRLSSTPALRRRNLYPQTDPVVNRRSPADRNPVVSNRATLDELERMQSRPPTDPRKKRRIRPRSASRPYLAKRSINVWARFPRPRRKGERAVTTDLAGQPLRKRNFETERPDVLINPTSHPYQRGRRLGDRPYTGKSDGYRSRTRTGRPWLGDITHRRVKENVTGKRQIQGQAIITPEKRREGMRPQGEGYSGNIKTRRMAKGGGSASARWNNRGEPLKSRPPGIGGFGVDRYRGFLRRDKAARRSQGEGYSGNIPFRGKEYRDQGEEFTGSIRYRRKDYRDDPARFAGRVPYRGRNFQDQGEEFTGNIRYRKKKYGDEPRFPGRILFRGRDFRDQGEEYTGNIKSRKPLKGGGSVSGRLWNNKGRAVPAKTPGVGARGIGQYQGNIRSARKQIRSQGEEYTGNIPARAGKGYADQGEEYSGHLKAGKPLKGGGSVSFRHWNNEGRAIPARTPGKGGRGIDKYQGNIRFGRHEFNDQGEEYTGSIKARKPLKGGGSVSFRHWNNKGNAVPARIPGRGSRGIERYQGNLRFSPHDYRDQGEEYAGNLKARKPAKGGGSVSFRHWNNEENPVPARAPGAGSRGIGKYQGSLRFIPHDYRDQGEEYTGHIKARKPLKGGGSVSFRHWNNEGNAVPARTPGRGSRGVDKYQGNLRFSPHDYRDQGEEYTGSIKTRKRSREPVDVNGLQVKVRQARHTSNRGAAAGSLPTLRPSKSSMRASAFARSIRQPYEYTRSQNSSRDALRVRAPGKAFARAVDYQGNVRLKKFELFEKRQLHPDAKFVKTNRNNAAGERDVVTNFKLWWARLFRRNETQPFHLKDKDHKPRYDKGEAGLWYD